jgi:hypothetical protein
MPYFFFYIIYQIHSVCVQCRSSTPSKGAVGLSFFLFFLNLFTILCVIEITTGVRVNIVLDWLAVPQHMAGQQYNLRFLLYTLLCFFPYVV